MKKAVICIVLSLSLLQGCGFLQKKKPDATISEKVVYLDPKALEPCQPLLRLDLQGDSFEDLLVVSVKNMAIYADCSGKQDNSIKLLREFSNNKEKPK